MDNVISEHHLTENAGIGILNRREKIPGVASQCDRTEPVPEALHGSDGSSVQEQSRGDVLLW